MWHLLERGIGEYSLSAGGVCCHLLISTGSASAHIIIAWDSNVVLRHLHLRVRLQSHLLCLWGTIFCVWVLCYAFSCANEAYSGSHGKGVIENLRCRSRVRCFVTAFAFEYNNKEPACVLKMWIYAHANIIHHQRRVLKV